jgi:hypothetical protein
MNIKLNESYYGLIKAIQNDSNLSEINCKFKIFVDELTKFSINEPKILSAYRTLNQITIDIHSKSKTIDLTIYNIFERITALLEVEIKIALLKLENPILIKMDKPDTENVLELLNWTDDKNDLVALIYAIFPSINNGNAKIKKIVRCFEHIFQINLGNIYDVLQDLNIRKEGPCTYLESLPDALMKKIDKLNRK